MPPRADAGTRRGSDCVRRRQSHRVLLPLIGQISPESEGAQAPPTPAQA